MALNVTIDPGAARARTQQQADRVRQLNMQQQGLDIQQTAANTAQQRANAADKAAFDAQAAKEAAARKLSDKDALAFKTPYWTSAMERYTTDPEGAINDLEAVADYNARNNREGTANTEALAAARAGDVPLMWSILEGPVRTGVMSGDQPVSRGLQKMLKIPLNPEQLKEDEALRISKAAEERAVTEEARKVIQEQRAVAEESRKVEEAEQERNDIERRTEGGKFSVKNGLTQVTKIRGWQKNQGSWFFGADGMGIYAALKWLPGTDAYELDSLILPLKSKAFLENIQHLRGLGQVSNIEGEKAEAAVANLDPGAGPEIFGEQLKIIEDFLKNSEYYEGPASKKTPPPGDGTQKKVSVDF